MPRARLDHKPRKDLGFAVPEGVSGKDAWTDARILKDESTAPLPGTPDDMPKKQSVRADLGSCQCRCMCGAQGANGLCYLCERGYHHRCSRSCEAYQQTDLGRGVKVQYIPARIACGGGARRSDGSSTSTRGRPAF